MEEDEFDRLFRLVQGLLREQGLPEIADESNFIEAQDGEQPPRLMEPQKRLVAILEALDVHLMLNDSNVVRRSLDLISETCDGPGPRTAVVVMPRDRGTTSIDDLLALPDLNELREALRKLIYRLTETPLSRGRL